MVICESTDSRHQNTKLEAISRTASAVVLRGIEGVLFGKFEVTFIPPGARK
jgi:hypothetical protein